jgi:phage-related protein
MFKVLSKMNVAMLFLQARSYINMLVVKVTLILILVINRVSYTYHAINYIYGCINLIQPVIKCVNGLVKCLQSCVCYGYFFLLCGN